MPMVTMTIWDRTRNAYTRCRASTAKVFQSILLHKIAIVVIVVDVILVVIDLAYSLIHPPCDGNHESPEWVEILTEVSFALSALFMLEITLTIWSLGLSYINPFGGVRHALVHLLDVCIVVSTFVLELVLHGTERELAGLLVFLRLWRIIKLLEEVILVSGDLNEEEANELRTEMAKVKQQLSDSQAEVDTLRKRIRNLDNAMSSV